MHQNDTASSFSRLSLPTFEYTSEMKAYSLIPLWIHTLHVNTHLIYFNESFKCTELFQLPLITILKCNHRWNGCRGEHRFSLVLLYTLFNIKGHYHLLLRWIDAGMLGGDYGRINPNESKGEVAQTYFKEW